MHQGLLRLLKVASHIVTIVEVPAEGGEGEEYDPWNPGERWAAELTWLADDRFSIVVGPYRLEALAEDPDRFAYSGIETGPNDEHEFTVVGLSTELDFDRFVDHTYAMIGRGNWTPVRYNPKGPPPYATYYEPQPVGVALFWVPPEVADLNAGENHNVVAVEGIRGGKSDTIKIERIPTSTEPLYFSIDEIQSFRGSYEWYGSDTLQPDLHLPGYRSEKRIVMRCLERMERPSAKARLWLKR